MNLKTWRLGKLSVLIACRCEKSLNLFVRLFETGPQSPGEPSRMRSTSCPMHAGIGCPPSTLNRTCKVAHESFWTFGL